VAVPPSPSQTEYPRYSTHRGLIIGDHLFQPSLLTSEKGTKFVGSTRTGDYGLIGYM
jgi:hypothetical protein